MSGAAVQIEHVENGVVIRSLEASGATRTWVALDGSVAGGVVASIISGWLTPPQVPQSVLDLRGFDTGIPGL